MSRLEQTQNTYEDQKPKPSKNGRGWIGNIVKDVKRQTPEEYWKSVRETILPEYLSVFDSTQSRTLKETLKHSSLAKPEYRFIMSIHDFEDLTEKDFLDLKQFTDTLKLRVCDPGKLLLAIFKKKEVEHYSIDFKLSEETIQDIFNKSWINEHYIISF